MRAYYWRWIKTAFTHSVGVFDLWVGLLTAIAGVIDHYWPQGQIMTAYAWQIPVWALAAVMFIRLLMAPYWMWQEDESKRPIWSASEPISLLDFARLAEWRCGWDLFSKSESSGWQTWDLINGLRHAANDNKLAFEGKRFKIYSSPPDNPFVRRDELFMKIEPKDWYGLMLTISVPGSSFGIVEDKFELSICSSLAGNDTRYWDIRLTNRDAAINWLEKEGAGIKGQGERLYAAEEERKALVRAALGCEPKEKD